MARPFLSGRSSRTCSSFQKYLSLPSRSLPHPHPQPPASSQRLYPPSILSAHHYASSSNVNPKYAPPPPSNPPRRRSRQNRPGPSKSNPEPDESTQPDRPLPGPWESDPPPRTHYDLFPMTLPNGPPPGSTFSIPLEALHSEYLILQTKAHPDANPYASKLKHEGISAAISEAYLTLKDPLLRAQYLLALQGMDIANDERMQIRDPGLLMRVMEAREEIEGAETREQIHECWYQNEMRIFECVDALETAFAEGDFESAKQAAVRMRYWVNIRDNLDVENWERNKNLPDVH